MPQIRRRYYIWLFRAYVKKWKKTILLSAVFGAAIFFILIALFTLYVRPNLERQVQKIGYWGTYEIASIPDTVLSDISYGLTTVEPGVGIKPAAAEKWEVQDDGKTYVFHLKKGLHFHDGTELTADNVNLSFKDVERQRVGDYAVAFKLKNPYAPFLYSVSKPIFGANSNGLGEYKLTDVDVNAGFVRSLILQNVHEGRIKKQVYFYPTQDALKLAFTLGEVDKISGIDSSTLLKTDLATWKNAKVTKTTDYSTAVTLFYNNEDPILSDKKVRQALDYSLAEDFPYGERAYSPIPPGSPYYYENAESQVRGLELARTVLEDPSIQIDQDTIISTTPEYEVVAKQIQDAWRQIGIDSKIQIVNGIPANFQVLLYRFKIPQDPDQYTLWHSTGANNITKYKNLRIDKLLEDGRSIASESERETIYSDFQKYLLDDVPASFLYFPTQYTIERK